MTNFDGRRPLIEEDPLWQADWWVGGPADDQAGGQVGGQLGWKAGGRVCRQVGRQVGRWVGQACALPLAVNGCVLWGKTQLC